MKLTPKKVQRLRTKYEKELSIVKHELSVLQTLCPHESITKEGKSSTGNYDKSSDSYWTEFICLDCGKQWQEDQ